MHGFSRVELLPDGRYAPVLKVKGQGKVDLGSYSTARLAAVAHDVARLVFIKDMRPSTDLKCDQGTHYPADGYLCDAVFKLLLANQTTFDDVCGLLRSGALADQFLCARDRQTRHTGSAASDERPAGSAATTSHRREASHGAGDQQQRHGQAPQPPPLPQQQEPASAALEGPAAATEPPQPVAGPPQQQREQPPPSPAPAPAAGQREPPCGGSDAGSPAPGRKPPMRWVEWPTKGGGQFACCISERALKANPSLPSRMKRELFQVAEPAASIAAHDLRPGSSLRWTWEVRDYVKEGRTSTYICSLGAFFKHYSARAGDVMVVVASAPGAVKTTVWPGSSPDAARFKAHLAQLAAPGGGARKRGGEAPPPARAAAKAARAAAAAPPARRPDAAQQQQQQHGTAAQPDGQAQLQEAPAAAPCAGRPSQQPSPPPPPQAQARLLSNELVAAAEAGLAASQPSGGDDTGPVSPQGQVAQSPFRSQPLLPPAPSLPPSASAVVAIKRERSPPPAAAQGASPPGPAAAAARAAGGHSPARMSCADAPSGGLRVAPAPAASMQAAHAAHSLASAERRRGAGDGEALPDAMALAADEDGVYRAMSRLLTRVVASGRVPPEAVSSYRRAFGHLEPAGRRWFHYDSLKQLFDEAHWDDVQGWLEAR